MHTFLRACFSCLLLLTALEARAQLDYSANGVLDLSYGRFEPSGALHDNRFNSNSLSASFVGATATYALENGWTPGVTLQTFLRFQDFKTGRNDEDPFFSRNAFFSLGSKYGALRIGRLQTLLFDTTARFNALGNSPAFSPALRHLYFSGNLEGVVGDFFWNRAVSFSSPNYDGITVNAMYSQGDNNARGHRSAANIVVSKGLFGAALSAQRVKRNDGIIDPIISEDTWQLAATYNFGFVRTFGLYTHNSNRGLDVRANLVSAGVAVPVGPGTVQAQFGRAMARGVAVDRKQTSTTVAYVYPYDSVTDFYIAEMDDRVRAQTRGISVAGGVRLRF